MLWPGSELTCALRVRLSNTAYPCTGAYKVMTPAKQALSTYQFLFDHQHYEDEFHIHSLGKCAEEESDSR